MPDRGATSVHQVCGLVSGANWRVTKFTVAAPPHHTCALCQLISEKTLLLPCFHVLCESCLNYSVVGGNAVCPLDEEPFVAEECQAIQLPPGAGNKLKACCWNDTRGCTFVGTLQAVLTHFEQDCNFHAVSCPRCGESVLHQNLPSHYRSGCQTQDFPAATANTTLQQGVVLSSKNVSELLEELKTHLEDPYQDRLPALQSQINEILEQTRHHGAQFEEIARALRDTELKLNNRLTMVSRELSTGFSGELHSHQRVLCSRLDRIAQADGSERTGERGLPRSAQMPWKLEKKHILRKLELITYETRAYLQRLHETAQPRQERHVLQCEPLSASYEPSIDIALDMSPPWGDAREQSPAYRVLVTNTDDIYKAIYTKGKIYGLVTKWHRRDTYFQVAVGLCKGPLVSLEVFVKVGTTLETARPAWNVDLVSVIDPDDPKKIGRCMKKVLPLPERASYFGFQHSFSIPIKDIKASGYARDGKLAFLIYMGELPRLCG
ncbi:uncharacterized protein LOC144159606 [Haemaphysalis longicornis]